VSHVLGDLLAALPAGEIVRVDGPEDVRVDHFVQDSREVGPGGVFVATRGSSWDGHAFIDAAIERGVSVVVTETAIARTTVGAELARPSSEFQGTWIQVKDGLVALAWLAAAWYGHPGSDVRVLATTGTNGKTTTTFLLHAILRAWGKTVGLLSTVEVRIGDERRPSRCASATSACRRSSPPRPRPTSSACSPRCARGAAPTRSSRRRAMVSTSTASPRSRSRSAASPT
jgi:UDP-N-acetylmuramoyl-L-alanyl-D-glutamate--2,6-diaminopimelate ligase